MCNSTQTPTIEKKPIVFFVENVLIITPDGISSYVEGRHVEYLEKKKKNYRLKNICTKMST
jgi:hypothetical protein